MSTTQTPLADAFTLPSNVEGEVTRENLVVTFENHLEEADVFIVQGEKNIGKTTALAQFYRKHSPTSAALFLRGSRWVYEIGRVTSDLLGQVSLAAGEIDTSGSINERLSRAFHSLARKSRRENKKFYFIVDGLDEIPPGERGEATSIIDLLPFGYPQFRFLLSGTLAEELTKNRYSLTIRHSVLPAAGMDDARLLFSGVINDEALLSVIVKISRGNFGYLNEVRRLLKAGLIEGEQALPKSINEAFALQWDRVVNSRESISIFALLAFDQREHTIKSIAAITQVEAPEVQLLASEAGFVVISDDKLRFVSDSFREFASERLRAYRATTLDSVADWLLTNERNRADENSLPEILSETQRYEDLVEVLTPTFLSHSIKTPSSSRILQKRAKLGVNAAASLGRADEALRLGLIACNLEEFYCDDDWRLRVESFLSIKDEKGALSLARAAHSQEERVQSLCTIGRYQRTTRGKCDEDLKSEVTSEFRKLDVESLGRRGLEIAADLVYVSSELALKILQAQHVGPKGQESLDLALAQISLRGVMSAVIGGASDGCLRDTHEQIVNPELRCFTSAMRAAVSELGEDTVLLDVERLKSDQERLYFLRQWLSELKRGSAPLRAIDTAARLLVSSESGINTPSAYLDILKPLVSGHRCEAILSRIDGQSGVLEKKGPTAEYARLQLRIADLQYDYDRVCAVSRVEDIYLKISWHSDPATKLVVLSRILKLCKRWREGEPRVESLLTSVEKEVVATLEIIHKQCAEHFDAVRISIRLLTSARPELAFKIADSLNTRDRRDRAFGQIFYTLWLSDDPEFDVSVCREAFRKIEGKDVRSVFLTATVREAVRMKQSKTAAHMSVCREFAGQGFDALDRALAFACFAALAQSTDAAGSVGYIKVTSECLAQVPESEEKLSQLYNICLILADSLPEESRKFLGAAEEMRSTFELKSSSAQRLLLLNAKLAIRAYAGLLPKHHDTDLQLATLRRLVARSPSVVDRVTLYTDLAARLYIAGRDVSGASVVREDILPILNEHRPITQLCEFLVEISAPVLYRLSELECFDWLERLSPACRDSAVSSTIVYILTKLSPGDPHSDLEKHISALTYESARNVLRLALHSKNDKTIALAIKYICTFLDHEKASRLTPAMRADLLHDIDEAIESSFPTPGGVPHLGYKVLSKIYRARSERAKQPVWSSLRVEAKAIGNVADSALILYELVENAPAKYSLLKKEILEEAYQMAVQIPYRRDSLGRLELIAESARREDVVLFRKCVDQIMGIVPDGDDELPTVKAKRRAVDLAYEVDPQFAETLCALHEADPKKAGTSKCIKEELEYLRMKNDAAVLRDSVSENSRDNELGRACWANLGQLNSGKLSPAEFQKSSRVMKTVAGWDVGTAFPVLSFIVECVVRTYSQTAEASGAGILKRVMDVCLGTCTFVCEMASGNGYSPRVPAAVPLVPHDGSIKIEPGQREQALKFVENWLTQFRGDRLLLIDPYFSPDCLDAIALIRSKWHDCSIDVICGGKEIYAHGHADQLENYIRALWAERHAVSDIGALSLFAVTDKNGRELHHDRWWLADTGGIRFGTSWNSLGITKISDISTFRPAEAAERFAEMSRYADVSFLRREKRNIDFRCFFV